MGEEACGSQAHSSVESAIEHVKEKHGNVYTQPWWGDKNTRHLINVGMVIGFKNPANDKAGWRLDYDGTKGLHINFEDTSQTPKISVYHKVLAPALGGSAESVMLEYWLAWTKRYREDIPPPILTEFRQQYNATVNLKGGSDAQQLRLSGTKYALFGLGAIPGSG